MDNINSQINDLAAHIEAIDEVLKSYDESDWNKVERKNLPEIQRKLKAYTFQAMQEEKRQLRELKIFLLKSV